MFAKIRFIVLLGVVYHAACGPAYEGNPFLQVLATSKPPPSTSSSKANQTNLYVVLPFSGQQLQQSPPVVQPSKTPSLPIANHVHSFDCVNHANSPHATEQVQQLSNSNTNDIGTTQTVNSNTPELNRRCLKSTGLFLGTSCNKFVSCLNGTATELNCPEGLLFNAEGLYCDRPENVQCNGKTSSATAQHADSPSRHSSVGSPIHASLVQFSAVPPHQTSQQQLLQLQQQHLHNQQVSQSSGNANSFVQEITIPATSTQASPIVGTSTQTTQVLLSGVQQHNQQQHQQQSHQQHHNQQQSEQKQQYHQESHQNQQYQQQYYQQQHNQQQSYQEHQHQQNYQQQQHQQEQQLHLQQNNQQQIHQQQHHQQQQHQQQQLQQQQQNNQEQHHQQHNHQEQYQQQQHHQQQQNSQEHHQQHLQQQHQHQHQQQNNQEQHHQQQNHQEKYQQQQHHQQQQQNNQEHQQQLLQEQQVSQSAGNGNVFVQAPISAQQTGIPAINIGSLINTNEISGSDSDTRCLTLRGQFPSNACHMFLNCWGGVATEQACPDGLLFSTKGYCDYPENVNCAGRVLVAQQPIVAAPVEIKSPPPPTATPSFVPTTIPTVAVIPTTLSTPTAAPLPTVIAPELKNKCLTGRGQFPSTTCNKFVNCWDNIILEQECPEGFLFSTKGYCDFSHNVRCGDRPVESRGTATSSGSECPLDNGTFRDRKRCSSYFTCAANKVVARYECPEGLNYNDYLGVCDFSYRVDCSKDPLLIPGRSNTNAVAQLRRGDECPADFATYRDASNCGIYYTCVSKTIVATYECPAGFSFNDEIGICDYAERVDCTKAPRIFQVPKNVLPQVTNDIKQKIETCTPGSMFSLNPQCTAVCLCRNGVAEIVQCPAGLAYDSKMDKCILPHLARC